MFGIIFSTIPLLYYFRRFAKFLGLEKPSSNFEKLWAEVMPLKTQPNFLNYLYFMWKGQKSLFIVPFLTLILLIILIVLCILIFVLLLFGSHYFRWIDFLYSFLMLGTMLGGVCICLVKFFVLKNKDIAYGILIPLNILLYGSMTLLQGNLEIAAQVTESNAIEVSVHNKKYKLLREYSNFSLLYNVKNNQIFTINPDLSPSSLRIVR